MGVELLAAGKAFVPWINATLGNVALGTLPTLHSTAALTWHVLNDGTVGDLVECGVFSGAHPAIMSHVCSVMAHRRRVHLFDSFDGIPHASEKDIQNIAHRLFSHGKDGKLISSGISVCSAKRVKLFMRDWGVETDMLVYHVGWFQNTLPDVKIDKIALLRLDADLYESTKVCMKHLYDRVSPGGFVIIDDWRLTGARTAVEEYLGCTPEVVCIPGGKGPVFWRK